MHNEEVKSVLSGLRKKFGKESIFVLGDTESLNIEFRSSGSIALDYALGGGYPKGRICEIYGKERGGKTTVLCLAIAEAQKSEPDKVCALIDLENTFNVEWAKLLGVDIDSLAVVQPDFHAEKVWELVYDMVTSNKFSIIGIDSLAGLVPKHEFEQTDWDKDSRVGGSSKLNTTAIRKIINSKALLTSKATILCINQIRDHIGGFSPFGTPTTTPGGRALKFAYSQRLELSISEYFNKGNGDSRQTLGQQIKIKVQKNKVAPPYKTTSIDLYYNEGVDKLPELIKVAKQLGILLGTSWLKIINPSTGELLLDEDGNEVKFNGQAKLLDYLRSEVDKEEYDILTHLYKLVDKQITIKNERADENEEDNEKHIEE